MPHIHRSGGTQANCWGLYMCLLDRAPPSPAPRRLPLPTAPQVAPPSTPVLINQSFHSPFARGLCMHARLSRHLRHPLSNPRQSRVFSQTHTTPNIRHTQNTTHVPPDLQQPCPRQDGLRSTERLRLSVHAATLACVYRCRSHACALRNTIGLSTLNTQFGVVDFSPTRRALRANNASDSEVWKLRRLHSAQLPRARTAAVGVLSHRQMMPTYIAATVYNTVFFKHQLHCKFTSNCTHHQNTLSLLSLRHTRSNTALLKYIRIRSCLSL